jgi:hypothetical protein
MFHWYFQWINQDAMADEMVIDENDRNSISEMNILININDLHVVIYELLN